VEIEVFAMLAPPDAPTLIGRYFDLAEYVFFRGSLLVLFVLGLLRLIEQEWKKRSDTQQGNSSDHRRSPTGGV
jgi:hypothetical protein